MGSLGLRLSMLNSGGGGGIPFKSDAFAHYDGTILYSAPNYYFVDKKSGRNLLITGYDFDTTWAKGFPYKSAATISAPAGDAAFIAADLNSFFYTAGTPNQIPVISLFQNIDYKDRLFTKHAAQGVDGDGVETYEPRVLDIVLYTNAKTGADLTKCQTYYRVPAIVAGAKFIDPVNGNDSTGNGNQATPYKTHSKVNGLTLTEGTQVYCLTGNIAPIAWSKNYNLKAIGLTKIQNVSSGRGIDYDPAGTLAQTIEGYWVDMANRAASVAFNFSPVNHQLTINKFYITNCVSHGFSSGPSVNQLISVNNSVQITSLYNIYCNKNITVNGGKYSSTDNFIYKDQATARTININNVKSSNPTFLRLAGEVILNVIGSIVTASTQLFQLTTLTGTWRFIGSKFNLTYASASAFIDLEDHRTTSVEFDGCEFTSRSGKYVGLMNQQIIKYNRNITHIADNDGSVKLSIETRAAGIQSIFEIEGNTFNSNSILGSIQIGTEPATTYANKDSGTINKNRARILGQSHGVMITNNNSVIVTHNYLFGGTSLPLGFKCTQAVNDYSNSIAAYNVILDGTLLSKGCMNLRFYNNTIINRAWNVNSPVNLAITISDQSSVQGNKVKNNIIIYTDSTQRPMIRLDHENNEIDYNIYYCSQTELTFYYKESIKTWAEWQALGFDTHSIVLTTEQFNGLFTDFANGDYSLKEGSVAKLFCPKIDGFTEALHPSTNWGSNTQIPTVVTAEQVGDMVNCGAYGN
jgi:hypothetical protein